MLHWVVASSLLLMHTHTHTHTHHAFLYCLQIPLRLNFAAEQYLNAVKTNMGPRGLIVRTRVLPVETWKLLAHSALVSGFALTTTLFPDSERKPTSLHALQNLIMMHPARTLQHKYLMNSAPTKPTKNFRSHTKLTPQKCCWTTKMWLDNSEFT